MAGRKDRVRVRMAPIPIVTKAAKIFPKARRRVFAVSDLVFISQLISRTDISGGPGSGDCEAAAFRFQPRVHWDTEGQLLRDAK